jgi:hypothetical protein
MHGAAVKITSRNVDSNTDVVLKTLKVIRKGLLKVIHKNAGKLEKKH